MTQRTILPRITHYQPRPLPQHQPRPAQRQQQMPRHPIPLHPPHHRIITHKPLDLIHLMRSPPQPRKPPKKIHTMSGLRRKPTPPPRIQRQPHHIPRTHQRKIPSNTARTRQRHYMNRLRPRPNNLLTIQTPPIRHSRIHPPHPQKLRQPKTHNPPHIPLRELTLPHHHRHQTITIISMI